MTIPYERTRAVIQTQDFLKQIASNTELPELIRNQARGCLRHYPDPYHFVVVSENFDTKGNPLLECPFSHPDEDFFGRKKPQEGSNKE